MLNDAERGIGADEHGLREVGALRSDIARARNDIKLATELSQRALAQLPEAERWVRGSLLLSLGAAAYFNGGLLASEKSLAEASALGERAANSLQVLCLATPAATLRYSTSARTFTRTR